jgi:uncharacterized membrane protein
MALSHLHLILNHVPVIGSVVALGLLLLGIARRSVDLRRAGLEVFAIVALLTLPVYLTGLGAQTQVVDRTDPLMTGIRAHHDAALVGSAFMLLTGLFAWIALWQTRRMARPAPGVQGAVLLFAVLTMALMGRAANLGGQIRHPEVWAGGQAAQEWGWSAQLAEWATHLTWLWPAAETLHFIGMWLLFGIVLAINLRLLGMMKSVSFAALHRLLPWAVLGLVINIVTGMLFAIGAPGQYVGYPFYWKIGLLMLAGFNLLYVTVVDASWNVRAGDAAPMLARTLAGTSIAAWLAVMYFGRMLPFLGMAF